MRPTHRRRVRSFAAIVGGLVCATTLTAPAAARVAMPTSVTLKRSGPVAVAGRAVTIAVRARPARGRRVLRYSVMFGDKTKARRASGAPPRTLRHRYRAAGSFRVTLTVTDSRRRRASARLTLRVRAAPVATPPPPPAAATLPAIGRIAAGRRHVCALLAPGGVVCSGSASLDGQLGDGTLQPSATPVKVSAIANAVAVASGDVHSCALLATGAISCWGGNYQGQLGGQPSTVGPTPTPVTAISSAIAVAAGGANTCALLSDRTVSCWGANVQGQLGNAAGTLSNAPVPVIGVANAVAIAVGGHAESGSEGTTGHACALLSGGSVTCWGAYDFKQPGQPNSADPGPAPVIVPGVAGATSIALGPRHSCAVLATGSVDCWGNAPLGTGVADGLTPHAVVGVTNATAVAAAGGSTIGMGHTCALLTTGLVSCWGTNDGGQLGDGTMVMRPAPVAAAGVSGATAITAAGRQTCVLLTSLRARCWGTQIG